MKKSVLHSKPVVTVLVGLLLLVLWHIAAKIINAPVILPSPWETYQVLKSDFVSLVFWEHIGTTFLRSITAFFITVVLGFLLGTLAGISVFFDNFLALPLSIVKATPVVSFILLAVFWFGTFFVPVFVAVLMSLPVMISAVKTGINNTDKNLLDFCKVFGLSYWSLLQHIYIPSCVPYFFSGAVSAFGLSWKVVAAGEVLALPTRAAGTLLQTAKVHIETAQVFAVTIVLIVICFIVEASLNFVLHSSKIFGWEK